MNQTNFKEQDPKLQNKTTHTHKSTPNVTHPPHLVEYEAQLAHGQRPLERLRTQWAATHSSSNRVFMILEFGIKSRVSHLCAAGAGGPLVACNSNFVENLQGV